MSSNLLASGYGSRRGYWATQFLDEQGHEMIFYVLIDKDAG